MPAKEVLDSVIRQLYEQGQTKVSAVQVAELLWPNGRSNNANGQVFHLSAGVAARMLRCSKLVWEFEPRHWEIIGERIESSSRYRIEASCENDNFIIQPHGSKWELSVEPEFRSNGTQNYDGWFPRLCSSQRSAKAMLTKFIGETIVWTEK